MLHLSIPLAARLIIILAPISLQSLFAQETAQEASQQSLVDKYREEAEKRWSEDIAKLQALDASENDPDDAVLFIGSSSIRRWDSIAADMAPFKVIKRGYGGAKFRDLAVFANRLIQPHHYKAVVVFVANDVTGGENDTPLTDFRQLVFSVIDTIQNHSPKAPVFLIEITPTPSRFAAWSEIREANSILRDLALTTPHTYFIETAENYLDVNKHPRADLFVDDQLHLNAEGYRLWSRLIRESLSVHLNP